MSRLPMSLSMPHFQINHDPALTKIFDEMMAATVGRLGNHSLLDTHHYSALATLFQQIECSHAIKEALQLVGQETDNKSASKIKLSKHERQLLALVGLTQDLLMRPAETKGRIIERGDIPEAEHFEDPRRRRIILNAFAALGISTPQEYTSKFPVSLIICGGFLFRVQKRVETAIEFMKQNNVIELIIAGGSRPLKADKRDIGFLKEKFPEEIKEIAKLSNELDGLKFIIKIFEKKYPDLFKKGKDFLSFTETLPKPGCSRAHTDDVASEIKTKSKNKDLVVVLVSDAPFTLYQLEIHRFKMGNPSIVGIGAAADPSYHLEDYYDALGRLLLICGRQVLSQNHPELSVAEIDQIINEYKTAYSKKYQSIITKNTEAYIKTLEIEHLGSTLMEC